MGAPRTTGDNSAIAEMNVVVGRITRDHTFAVLPCGRLSMRLVTATM
jgi:hypothetical protein